MSISRPVPAEQPLVDLGRLHQALAAADVDAIVGHSQIGLLYLANFACLDYMLEEHAVEFAVLPRDPAGRTHLTLHASARGTLEDYPSWVTQKWFYDRNFYVNGAPELPEILDDAVAGLVRALHDVRAQAGRVGFELAHLPVTLSQRIARELPGMTMVDAGPLLEDLRKLKTDQELARIRVAVASIDAAIAEAFARVDVGVTDTQIDTWIRERLVADGVEPRAIGIGVGAGGARPWAYAADRRAEAGDLIKADITATYGGYYGDMARTCVVGTATAQQRELYAMSRDAVEAGIAAVRPGVNLSEIFEAAMAVPRARGAHGFRRHHVGHNIGLALHEQPLLAPGSEEARPGMALTIEVPHYIEHVGAYSVEDVVIVTEDGAERLTTAPAALPVAGS